MVSAAPVSSDPGSSTPNKTCVVPTSLEGPVTTLLILASENRRVSVGLERPRMLARWHWWLFENAYPWSS